MSAWCSRRGTQARYESSKDLHAKHDEAPPAPRPPLSDVCCRDADALPVAEPTIPSRASSVVLRVGILTVSDRAAAGVYQDRSGPEVEACLREVSGARGERGTRRQSLRTACALADCSCSAQTAARVPGTWRLEAVRTTIVPDEEARIEATLREWLSASASACNLVLTTGGTGFAPRDVTPEATARVLTRRTPQLIELALRAATARGDAHGAALSRGIAGVVESNGMVVNLPGRPHAARENLAAMLPVRESRARAPGPARPALLPLCLRELSLPQVLPHAVAQATGRV